MKPDSFTNLVYNKQFFYKRMFQILYLSLLFTTLYKLLLTNVHD